MSLKTFNTVLTSSIVLFALWFGTEYILSPGTVAPGFGLPHHPSGNADGFYVVKGVRDVTMALGVGVLLVTGHRRALALLLLTESLVAYGDMTNVLGHHGSVVTALSVHCLTATLMVVNGLLMLKETRSVAAAPATPAPVAGSVPAAA